MADADDAERGAFPVAALAFADGEERGDEVVGHALGVAPRGALHADTEVAERGEVDVVGAGDAATDEADGRTFEQGAGELAGGADEEEVAVGQVVVREVAAIDGAGLAEAGEELGAKLHVAVVEDIQRFHSRACNCSGVTV